MGDQGALQEPLLGLDSVISSAEPGEEKRAFTPHALDSPTAGSTAGTENIPPRPAVRSRPRRPTLVTTSPSTQNWMKLRQIVASKDKKREEQVDYWRTNITRNSVHQNPLENITLPSQSAEKVHYWPKCCRQPGGKAWRSLETFVFLGLLGCFTSSVALGYRICCTYVQDFVAGIPYVLLNKTMNVTVPAVGSLPLVDILLVLSITTACGIVLAMASVLATQLIAPHATGSGIPRMKLLFSGVYISKFLSVKTVIVKIFALLCAAASGLSVGSEGPFVHISCGISKMIMRLPFFQSYRFNAVKAHGMLTVGCATGVVAAFGSPFGGVLFAIEVVSTFFRISDMPRMFWASIAGTFTARFLFQSGLSLFHADTKPSYVTDYPTYGLILLLGVLMGGISGGFIHAVRLVARWRVALTQKRQNSILHQPPPPRKHPSGSWRVEDTRKEVVHCSAAPLVSVLGEGPPDQWTSSEAGGAVPSQPVESHGGNDEAEGSSGAPLAGSALGSETITYSRMCNACPQKCCWRSTDWSCGCCWRVDRYQIAWRCALMVLGAVVLESLGSVLFAAAGTPTLATYNGSTTLFVDELFTFESNDTYLAADKYVVVVAGATVPMLTFFGYTVCKLVVTIIAICLPIPAGLFSPVFLLGALLGRLYGSLAQAFVASAGSDPWIVFSLGPADFAIIGAAAFAGGVTRAISTVVIVMELTGELYLQLPVAVCVLAAYFTANRISPSVYEVIAAVSMLPDLPRVDDSIDNCSVADAMISLDRDAVLFAHEGVTVAQLRYLLLAHPNMPIFAVVDSAEGMLLIGEVQRSEVENLVELYDHFVSADNNSLDISQSLQRGGENTLVTLLLDNVATDIMASPASQRGILAGVHSRSHLSTNPDEAPPTSGGESKSDGDDELGARLRNDALRIAHSAQSVDALQRQKSQLGLLLQLSVGCNPFSVQVGTALHQVNLLLHTLRLQHIHVVQKGRLHGYITRAGFIAFYQQLQRSKKVHNSSVSSRTD